MSPQPTIVAHITIRFDDLTPTKRQHVAELLDNALTDMFEALAHDKYVRSTTAHVDWYREGLT